jgi:hypothetical protein
MDVQTIELAGRRFVILPEEEFRILQQKAQSLPLAVSVPSPTKAKFASVQPLKVSGIPASEMLIQDRR